MGKVEINTEHINLQTDFGFKHAFGNIRKKEDDEIAYSQSLEKLRDTRTGISTDEAMCLSKKSLNQLDLNAILELDIPDIAKVYGGVRGRTMSSRHQVFAWPILKNAGIRTVIDLREDGCSSRLSQSCGKYGMDYFFFPVGQKHEAISTMVKLFPDFCEKIIHGERGYGCLEIIVEFSLTYSADGIVSRKQRNILEIVQTAEYGNLARFRDAGKHGEPYVLIGGPRLTHLK